MALRKYVGGETAALGFKCTAGPILLSSVSNDGFFFAFNKGVKNSLETGKIYGGKKHTCMSKTWQQHWELATQLMQMHIAHMMI